MNKLTTEDELTPVVVPEPEADHNATAKRAYVTPSLTVHGRFQRVTLDASIGGGVGGGGFDDE